MQRQSMTYSSFIHSFIMSSSIPFKVTSSSGHASPLLMAGHRQVISRIGKGSQNILINIFTITTFDCQGRGISARAFGLAWCGSATDQKCSRFQYKPAEILPSCCPDLEVPTGPCSGLPQRSLLSHPEVAFPSDQWNKGVLFCPYFNSSGSCILSGRPLCFEWASIGTALLP